MKTIGVIGGGISGLAVANLLKDNYLVKVFEKEAKPGGLIKCEYVDGHLFHKVGGHVFNTKRDDVRDWFWSFFDTNSEFTKFQRNAIAYLGRPISYPVENHIYQFESEIQKTIIDELIEINKNGYPEVNNLDDFLMSRFGKTLYDIYFEPYNNKIWNRNLKEVSISWLEGKLPMPTVKEIIYNNFNRENEAKMVHSSFFYPKINGSQFIADRLARGIDINYNFEIKKAVYKDKKWIINDMYIFDIIVFTGNIKELSDIIGEENTSIFNADIENLKFHGTTTVLCTAKSNPFTWIYLSDKEYKAHRIICTGNFSKFNNAGTNKSVTLEFTDFVDKDDILENIKKIPYVDKYVAHNYTKYTYPIQNIETRQIINSLKKQLALKGLFLVGRFAEWEYFNMDAAVGSAIDFSKSNFESSIRN